MKVFFDANILISLFRLSNADVESFQKLVSGARVDRFEIIATEQLRDEFERYREKAVSDGIANFSKQKISVQFPPFARRHAKFDETNKALKALNEALDEFALEVKAEAKNRNLLVDDVIKELFEVAIKIPETAAIQEAAKLRTAKGNPPGKNSAVIGDALHWESLLSQAKVGEHLCIITGDGDFSSELENNRPKDFLDVDWTRKTTSGRLEVFRSISSFLAVHASDIEIGSEFSADFLVTKLENSQSFRSTHDAVEQLRTSIGLTSSHVSRIVNAFHNNSQVYQIQYEDEIQDFLSDLFEGFGASSVGSSLQELLLDGFI